MNINTEVVTSKLHAIIASLEVVSNKEKVNYRWFGTTPVNDAINILLGYIEKNGYSDTLLYLIASAILGWQNNLNFVVTSTNVPQALMNDLHEYLKDYQFPDNFQDASDFLEKVEALGLNNLYTPEMLDVDLQTKTVIRDYPELHARMKTAVLAEQERYKNLDIEHNPLLLNWDVESDVYLGDCVELHKVEVDSYNAILTQLLIKFQMVKFTMDGVAALSESYTD